MFRLFFESTVVSSLIISMAGAPVTVSAQQAGAEMPTITIRANTRLVTVDVVVTDKKGQPITGRSPMILRLRRTERGKRSLSSFRPA